MKALSCRRNIRSLPQFGAGDRDETGSMSSPILFPLAVCLLVFPILIMVLSFPTWSERQGDATTAARDAARALVTAPDWNSGTTVADQIVREIVINNGLDPSQVTTSYTGSLNRGATVTASVTVLIPATVFPGLHQTTAAIHWTASSTEQVDQYRSLPGG
ncbi:MAG: hypothetical protein M3083_18100 [Actinomycetota bacterium]|nr:hypothetical protein [Actinomycetota bacterium]